VSEDTAPKRPAGRAGRNTELPEHLKSFKGVWVFVEHDRGRAHTVSWELIGEGRKLADEPRFFGTALQRRMWIKKHYMKLPFRYVAMFLYHYVALGAWRAGWVGYAWSRLRCDVYRLWEYKLREIRITGRLPLKRPAGPGQPDPRVRQY